MGYFKICTLDKKNVCLQQIVCFSTKDAHRLVTPICNQIHPFSIMSVPISQSPILYIPGTLVQVQSKCSPSLVQLLMEKAGVILDFLLMINGVRCRHPQPRQKQRLRVTKMKFKVNDLLKLLAIRNRRSVQLPSAHAAMNLYLYTRY